MARTKSLNDLDRQWERLKNNRLLNADRNKRVNEIYNRYWTNMSKTERFRKDDYNQVKAFASGNIKEYNKYRNILENRQYSRRAYMGLSNG